MTCVECGGKKFGETRHEHKHVVDGVMFRVKMKASRCAKCGAETVAATELGAGELAVATWLVQNAVISGASFRFMRKALLLRANALADLLGVTNESVSRWENGKREVDRSAWALLASMVLDRAEGSARTADRLEALRKPARPRKDVTLEAHPRD